MIHSDPFVAQEATRVDADGSTERAEFRGRPGERMLTHLNLPASAPRGAVVICSPILGEFMRNYRREVLLARRLARRGFAALRFHYRFSGNSDGEDEGLTFESMHEDALECIERVRGEAPDGPLILAGTRWGALVAASAASAHPEAGLVLWEPLLDTSGFFKAAFRSRLVRNVREGVERPPTGKELEDRLRAGEAVEVPGHRVQPALYRSSAGRTLERELGTTARAILAVQVGPTGSVRPDLARAVERWRAEGLEVETAAIRGEESWWLVDERWRDEAQRPLTKDLISLTGNWIEARTSDGRAR
jgi:pimeloyl-ACP methyl ester carboxylesterase